MSRDGFILLGLPQRRSPLDCICWYFFRHCRYFSTTGDIYWDCHAEVVEKHRLLNILIMTLMYLVCPSDPPVSLFIVTFKFLDQHFGPKSSLTSPSVCRSRRKFSTKSDMVAEPGEIFGGTLNAQTRLKLHTPLYNFLILHRDRKTSLRRSSCS